MSKHGGFPGGMGGMGGANMNNLMRQAQKMQQQLQQNQEEIEKKEFSASAGGGAVSVTMNGKHEVLSVTLDKEAVDPEDVEMLQDLIMAAMNEVIAQVDKETQEKMSALTGGFGGLGGMF